MATGDDSALLFPIGHCIGAYYDLPNSDDHFFQVRVGPDIIRLDDEKFAVWSLALGIPDRPPDQPWNRQTVLTAARRAGIGMAEQVLEGLIKDYLLVETTPGTDSAVDFARRHRLMPLMLGLGNTSEEPRLYSVGMVGMPVVSMSSMAYDPPRSGSGSRTAWRPIHCAWLPRRPCRQTAAKIARRPSSFRSGTTWDPSIPPATDRRNTTSCESAGKHQTPGRGTCRHLGVGARVAEPDRHHPLDQASDHRGGG